MAETTELDQGINDLYRDLLDIQNELIPVRPPQTLFREVIESDTYDDQVESLNESLDWLPEGPQSDAIMNLLQERYSRVLKTTIQGRARQEIA